MNGAFRFLKAHGFTLGIVVCVAAAYLFPGFFTEWRGFKLTRLIVPLLQVIMFGMGTTLTVRDFTRVLAAPLPVAIGAVLQFSVMPLVGLGIVKMLGLQGELAAGVILVGSVAGGVASNVISYLAHANVALSVTMTSVSTLLSPLVTPLLMKLLAGRYVTINAGDMALSIVYMIVVPIILGLVVHALLDWLFPRGNAWTNRILSWISMFGICFILAVILGPAHETLREAGLILLLAAALHNSTGYLLGYWMTRGFGAGLGWMAYRLHRRPSAASFISESDCRTISIEVGMQNSGMATALAIDILKSPIAALAPNIFGIWMDFSGSLLANGWNRHPPKALPRLAVEGK